MITRFLLISTSFYMGAIFLFPIFARADNFEGNFNIDKSNECYFGCFQDTSINQPNKLNEEKKNVNENEVFGTQTRSAAQLMDEMEQRHRMEQSERLIKDFQREINKMIEDRKK